MSEIEVGSWVTPADPAAFPGAVGVVIAEQVIYHSITGEPCARYVRVDWGKFTGPGESQIDSGVVLANGGQLVQPELDLDAL